jgi:DNA-binding transcriptional MerR regulator
MPIAPRPRAARSAPPPAQPTYTISELAREFALTTRAIRFYEDEGLIAPARVGRARVYGERDRVRIRLILRGKRLGLALAEIAEILDLYDAGGDRAQLSKFLAVLADRRARLLQQREDIDEMLADIAEVERECRRRLRGERGPGAPAAAQDADRAD